VKIILNYLVILIILTSGCNEEPKIEKEKVAHLYVDILIAGETYKHNSDSIKIITDSLYVYYKIPQDQYKNEIEKFQFSEETWDNFFKLAEEYLDTLKSQEERMVMLKEKKDSVSNINKDIDSD